jgi:TRAP-type C4-dicarboxylate transport system permease small subunit
MAWVAIEGGHVKVDLVVHYFPPRIQAVVDSVTHFFLLAICILIAWRSFLEVPVAREFGVHSQFFKVPTYPFYLVQAFSFAILFLVVLLQFIRKLHRAVKG